jgi:hypothetical protein
MTAGRGNGECRLRKSEDIYQGVRPVDYQENNSGNVFWDFFFFYLHSFPPVHAFYKGGKKMLPCHFFAPFIKSYCIDFHLFNCSN